MIFIFRQVITVAVLYNVFFVIARSVFWDMTHNLWMIFDYIADVIYLMDLFVRFTKLLSPVSLWIWIRS